MRAVTSEGPPDCSTSPKSWTRPAATLAAAQIAHPSTWTCPGRPRWAIESDSPRPVQRGTPTLPLATIQTRTITLNQVLRPVNHSYDNPFLQTSLSLQRGPYLLHAGMSLPEQLSTTLPGSLGRQRLPRPLERFHRDQETKSQMVPSPTHQQPSYLSYRPPCRPSQYPRNSWNKSRSALWRGVCQKHHQVREHLPPDS